MKYGTKKIYKSGNRIFIVKIIICKDEIITLSTELQRFYFPGFLKYYTDERWYKKNWVLGNRLLLIWLSADEKKIVLLKK